MTRRLSDSDRIEMDILRTIKRFEDKTPEAGDRRKKKDRRVAINTMIDPRFDRRGYDRRKR